MPLDEILKQEYGLVTKFIHQPLLLSNAAIPLVPE